MKKATRARLKQIRELLKKKEARDTSGLFAAEGVKIVKDIAAKGLEIDAVLVSHAFAGDKDNKALLSRLDRQGVPLYAAGESEFNRTSSLQRPEGILALVKKDVTPRRVLPDGNPAFVVLCDGIQDPGNLGAIIRTAAAFGVDCLMLTGRSADVYNPKAVRSSSGMVLEIPALAYPYRELDRLKKRGYRIFVSQADRKSGMDIGKIKKVPPLSIVAFGSEGKGVSGEVRARADDFFYIPTRENVESLNVASAVAISLFAFGKNRMNKEA
ncbi:MAG: RNA methyltransferase [Candidatus Omnitrophica bacterium]|nr:RNA methyltransferase [Candidatus Omnitrophota bacterium]